MNEYRLAVTGGWRENLPIRVSLEGVMSIESRSMGQFQRGGNAPVIAPTVELGHG
jgi:hypothetical protein